MTRIRAFVFVFAAAVAAACLAAAPAVAQDPAPDVAGATAAANAWRTALIAGDGEQLWGLASPATHERMAADLAELKDRLRSVPADRLGDTIDGLAVPARTILELKDGKAFFLWLVSRISADEKKKVEKVSIDTVNVNGDSATLSWRAEPGARITASAMPARATRVEGKWRIEVEE